MLTTALTTTLTSPFTSPSTTGFATSAATTATTVAPAAQTVRSAGPLTSPGMPSVTVNPNGTLPGTAQLTNLVGGMMTWVLLACVLAVLAGAAAWGFGARNGHFGASQQGRLMVLGGIAGAMITGAAAALVNFGFGVGSAVR